MSATKTAIQATLHCLTGNASSIAVSVVLAFVVTVPVNRALIVRGKGHAVVHDLHVH